MNQALYAHMNNKRKRKKKNEFRIPTSHIYKINKIDHRPKFNGWNFKILRENIDISLCDVGLEKGTLSISSKSQGKKFHKLLCFKRHCQEKQNKTRYYLESEKITHGMGVYICKSYI
jgi:hypothetical protein